MPQLPASPATKEMTLRVLVADDIEASRESLAALVRSAGHECITADTGLAALGQVAAGRPDLVLLDLLMPDIDGFEVTRRIRLTVTERWLPVVVTSSLQDEGDAHFIEALSHGADDFLPRPVNPALLEAKLRHYGRVLALQQRLAVLAQRQATIHDHIADPVITLDSAGRVAEANAAANALLCAQPAVSPHGMDFTALTGLPLGSLAGLREAEIAGHDGERRPMAIAHSEWTLGAQAFTTITLHDLSEQRAVERLKDEFLAGVSHELRTPLTSIVGALGLLAGGAAGPLPPTVNQLLQVAQRNGERLGRLIDDVLDLTKLEASRMPMQLKPRALEGLLAEAVAANAGYAARHGVSVRSDFPGGQALALVDADRFLQVMANLLSNAVKHSPPDQPVQVSLRGTGRGWRIEVRDHGPGVDPAFRARLFSKFAQADASDRRALGGTGLGLYITRLLVERMGGAISVESQPGQGATFALDLPSHSGAAGWLLCVVRDHQRALRLADWVGTLMSTEFAPDLEAARAVVARRGPPSAGVADPQGQGPVDAFCSALRGLGGAWTMAGDSLDPAFATELGMPWIDMAEPGARQALRDWMGRAAPGPQGRP